ncbi:MAG: hypothetical protein J5490_03535 [Bacteroidales bacterium]|nr:hypothetical protein [Bacteroidales bacterium]
MKALHIYSSAPFFKYHKDEEFYIDDFDILSAILSALTWQKYNGPIKLYADSTVLKYYRELGIEDLWNGGIDTETLDNPPKDIDQGIFWAAGKLLALKKEGAPVLMIDQDLIVWKNIDHLLAQGDILTFHKEYIDHAYPPLKDLIVAPGYEPKRQWSWNSLPCNTAIAFIRKQWFLDYYLEHALEFMKDNNKPGTEYVTRMVFAEQRILAMCAGEKRLKVHICLENPFQYENDTFTHIWGGKTVAREEPGQRYLLCKALISKIHKESPDFKPKTIKMAEIFRKYSE